MIDLSSTAFVFPGQGSQVVGMGADLSREFPEAAALFAEADRILHTPFSQLMFEGPAEQLDDTLNTQPALYIVGVATLRALESKVGALVPIGAAGHSLGELTALTAAGALPFEAGLLLVRERARLMKVAGAAQPGAMAAMLGPSVPEVQSICEQASADTGKPVVVANDNCPGQVVISGDRDALERAMTLAKDRGVKRVLKLAVSVAAHSPLMASVSNEFRKALDATPFSIPRYPVIGNANAQPFRTVEDIRTGLGKQLTFPVYWTDSVLTLRRLGASTFIEFGPKDVLTGLLKRIDREAVGVALNNAAAVATYAG